MRRRRRFQISPSNSQPDFDLTFKKQVERLRDLSFSNDWWPTRGSEDEAYLLALGLGEFALTLSEEEDLFLRDWKGEGMGRGWKGARPGQETAKVWLDEGKGILCARFPYKQEVIDEIRELIPKGKKSWNAESKLWKFSVEMIEVVVALMTKHFDEVIDLTQAIAPPQVVVSGDPFLALLDKDDLQAIHRLLAKKYHPDVNSKDGDKMVRINSIFNQLK